VPTGVVSSRLAMFLIYFYVQNKSSRISIWLTRRELRNTSLVLQQISMGLRNSRSASAKSISKPNSRHLWKEIEKFVGGKTDYGAAAVHDLLGADWNSTAGHLLAIGFFSKGNKGGEEVFSIPFLYRHGMNLTRGKA
jgi:hypothetical protein